MMTTITCMNLLEDLPAFLWRHTSLVDSSDTPFVQLALNDYVGLASSDELSLLDFIRWEFTPEEICKIGLCPCWYLPVPLPQEPTLVLGRLTPPLKAT